MDKKPIYDLLHEAISYAQDDQGMLTEEEELNLRQLAFFLEDQDIDSVSKLVNFAVRK